MKILIPDWLIILAGLGQIFTALVYPVVRQKVLHWFEDLKNLNPLNEAIAKTYGYYIQSINFVFGLMSVLLVNELQNPSLLSFGVTLFIALYWIGRISIQLKSYPIQDLSGHKYYTIGTKGMNILISLFAVVYLLLAINNSQIFTLWIL